MVKAGRRTNPVSELEIPIVGAGGKFPSDPVMARWLRDLVPRSRQRAGRAEFAHDLAADHATMLFQCQHGKCAISGLSFSLAKFEGVLVKHPFAPSLDRISSRDGYTADNVRLVCVAVNFGMGQWGEELYLTFARAAVDHSGRAARVVPVLAGTMLTTSNQTADDDAKWFSNQRERLAAAEAIAGTLLGEPLARQRRQIASLKRNLTLAPAGLRAAGAKAAQSRAD